MLLRHPFDLGRPLVALCACLVLQTACGGKDDAATTEESPVPGAAGPARVVLSDTAMRTAGIRVEEVRAAGPEMQADQNALVVPGTVMLDPRRVARVAPRSEVRVEELLVVEGDPIQEGSVMAVVSSPAFVAAQSDLLQAERRAELLRGTPDSLGGRALAAAAAQRLRLMGWTDAELAEVRRRGEPSATLRIRAPMSGRVLESHAQVGMTLAAGAPLFTVADLAVVEVAAEVPEASLALVRLGQSAVLSFVAAPGRTLEGRVVRLEDHLDPATRTLRVLLQVRNPSLLLKPGMFATARFTVSSSGARDTDPGVSIPASALVMDGESRIVFVEVAERTFERREVRVATAVPAGTMQVGSTEVRIVEGLRVGERIVTKGAFTLKSELAKAAFGEED